MSDSELEEGEFVLPGNAQISVWVDESGALKVCAYSSATRLLIIPMSPSCFNVRADRTIVTKNDHADPEGKLINFKMLDDATISVKVIENGLLSYSLSTQNGLLLVEPSTNGSFSIKVEITEDN